MLYSEAVAKFKFRYFFCFNPIFRVTNLQHTVKNDKIRQIWLVFFGKLGYNSTDCRIYESEEIKMKKILGLTSLAVVFLLTACGVDGETVCTMEEIFFGGSMLARIESDDNEITSATMELRIDISDMSDEEIQDQIDSEMRHSDDVDYEIDGDTLIFSQTIGGADLASEGLSRNLSEMVAEMEGNGATCD